NVQLADIGTAADFLEIQLPITSDDAEDYVNAAAQSLPQAREQATLDLVDGLLAAAGGLDKPAEQVIAYALLTLVAPPSKDLRLDIKMDPPPDGFADRGYGPLDVSARGSGVARIDGGLFNVDQLAPQLTDQPDITGD